MIKAVIFDCFGVLTEDGWLAFCKKYRNSENAEALRYINHQADRGLVSYEEFLAEVCNVTGAPREEAHTTITTTHHPNEPLFEYIKQLKKAGYTLGVISNVGDELTAFLPKHLVDLFDEITLSYQVRAIKPEPAIYEAHLEKLGLAPDETVFIDDREPNVEGAKSIGMNAVAYKNYEQLLHELHKLAIRLN